MNRRIFVKSAVLLPTVFTRMAAAGTTRDRKVLVAIFQRGAVDGLNVVVPYGEQAYYSARPNIAIARSDVRDLDGFFGAHPSLDALMPFWRDRSLAFVQAVGSPDSTRSHFDAQDFMECGTPGIKSTRDGFLARALGTSKKPLRGVAFAPSMPRILTGAPDAVAMTDIEKFGIRDDSAAAAFAQLYALDEVKILRAASKPRPNAEYPHGPLGDSLRQIAQLIKSDVGLEIAFTDVGGWDTHAAQPNALANNLKSFSEAIAAFAKDLGSRMSDVVVVTMSEFGRTVRENGNRGTDHGHATAMMLLGGGVKGGRVYGDWPGLRNLYEGRDLAVTTDFRDVFAEVVTKQLGAPVKRVFPGYEAKWRNMLA